MPTPLDTGLDLLRIHGSPVELLIAEILRTRQTFAGNPHHVAETASARWQAYVDGQGPPADRWPDAAPDNLLFGPRGARLPELPSVLRTAVGWRGVHALIELAAIGDFYGFPDELLTMCDKFSVDLPSPACSA